MAKYIFKLVVEKVPTKGKSETRILKHEINLNYTMDNAFECEKIVRDTAKYLAEEYITKEFY